MRILLGIVLGALLTVSAAYVHDMTVGDMHEATSTSLVNWDVVSRDWQGVQASARVMGDRIHDKWEQWAKN